MTESIAIGRLIVPTVLLSLAGCAAVYPLPELNGETNLAKPIDSTTKASREQSRDLATSQGSQNGSDANSKLARGHADSQDLRASSMLSIDAAVKMALRIHPDLLQARAAVDRSDAEIGLARSAWHPKVGIQGSGGYSTGSDSEIALSATQLLYDFGQTSGQIKAARATRMQRERELADVANKIAYQTARAFINVAFYQAQAKVSAEKLRSIERMRALIEMRAASGVSDRSDLLLADTRVQGAKAEEIAAQTSLLAAKVQLANLIGVMPKDLIDPSDSLLKANNTVTEAMFEDIPSVQAARNAEAAAAAKIDVAQAERYPKFGLEFRQGLTADKDNDDDRYPTSAMITVRAPVYQGGAAKYRIRAAEQERIAAFAAAESLKRSARGSTFSAQQHIAGARAQIATYALQESRAKETRDIYLEEYKLHKRSLSDLLNAELDIFSASSAKVRASYSILDSIVESVSATGSLTDLLGLMDSATPDTNS